MRGRTETVPLCHRAPSWIYLAFKQFTRCDEKVARHCACTSTLSAVIPCRRHSRSPGVPNFVHLRVSLQKYNSHYTVGWWWHGRYPLCSLLQGIMDFILGQESLAIMLARKPTTCRAPPRGRKPDKGEYITTENSFIAHPKPVER